MNASSYIWFVSLVLTGNIDSSFSQCGKYFPISASASTRSKPFGCKSLYAGRISRLFGGFDYSKWDKFEAGEEAQEESPFAHSVKDHMDLLMNHAGDIENDMNEDEQLDEAEDEQDPDWLCNLGEMESSAGYVDRAERCFQRALQINKTHVQTLLCYGKLLIERQDYESAEGMFATALKVDPSNSDAQIELKELCSPDENSDDPRDTNAPRTPMKKSWAKQV